MVRLGRRQADGHVDDLHTGQLHAVCQNRNGDDGTGKSRKWLNKTFSNSEEDECPLYAPPAGEKYNIEIHAEKHEGRDLADGAHGCMVLTGSPVHWHYDINN